MRSASASQQVRLWSQLRCWRSTSVRCRNWRRETVHVPPRPRFLHDWVWIAILWLRRPPRALDRGQWKKRSWRYRRWRRAWVPEVAGSCRDFPWRCRSQRILLWLQVVLLRLPGPHCQRTSRSRRKRRQKTTRRRRPVRVIAKGIGHQPSCDDDKQHEPDDHNRRALLILLNELIVCHFCKSTLTSLVSSAETETCSPEVGVSSPVSAVKPNMLAIRVGRKGNQFHVVHLAEVNQGSSRVHEFVSCVC